jgi:RimJ/RimL family protein N-acetyltransferase
VAIRTKRSAIDRPVPRPPAERLWAGTSAPVAAAEPLDWRVCCPELSASTFTLRELRLEDARSLLGHLSTEAVSRFISPPPTTVDGYEAFIVGSQRDREAGRTVCFGVVPAGAQFAVGLFQLRSTESGFVAAEWGFALGSAYWGTGLFVACAKLVLEFAFDTVGVLRLEARAAVMNGRGNGALRKTGAVQEGVLRRSFLRHGHYHDQVLWSILVEDWRLQRSESTTRIH